MIYSLCLSSPLSIRPSISLCLCLILSLSLSISPIYFSSFCSSLAPPLPVCLSPCLCLSVCLSLAVWLFLSVCNSLFFYLSVLIIHIFFFSLSLSLSLSVHLSFLSAWRSLILSVSLPCLCLSVSFSGCVRLFNSSIYGGDNSDLRCTLAARLTGLCFCVKNSQPPSDRPWLPSCTALLSPLVSGYPLSPGTIPLPRPTHSANQVRIRCRVPFP